MGITDRLLYSLLKLFLGVKETPGTKLGSSIKKIIVIRQHNQLGDLIVATPLFRALKESFPGSLITVIVSPQNKKALKRNPFINELFVFDKKRLVEWKYCRSLFSVLRKEYDLAIVPSITSISFTSNLLARLAKSSIRVGPASLNGEINHASFLFDKRVPLDWRQKEDTHAARRNLDIIEPFGISTENLKPIIFFNEDEKSEAKNFINHIQGEANAPVIGLHVGAGKIQNRWHYNNFAGLILLLHKKYNLKFYLSRGGKDDDEIINLIKRKCEMEFSVFDKPGMSLLAALIEQSDLFITNDTGPMHAAASTDTPTISLFGPTNPKMWAPLGKNKFYLHKGEDINLIEIKDVLQLSEQVLSKPNT